MAHHRLKKKTGLRSIRSIRSIRSGPIDPMAHHRLSAAIRGLNFLSRMESSRDHPADGLIGFIQIAPLLQAFNGLINYCARFIPNLAEKQHYIQRAIKNKNIADKEAQKAFEEIKTEIKKDRQLGRIDPKKKAIIYTDASHIQTGAAIVQQEDGKPTVKSYYSYTFKESELKWSILRKEAFAIHKAMKKFREMLKWHTLGMVEIRCDNQTLVKQLQKTEHPIDEIIAGIYQDINLRGINVNYVNGKENTLADALSRNISSKGVLKERGKIEIALKEIMELPIVVRLGKLSEKEMINSINLE